MKMYYNCNIITEDFDAAEINTIASCKPAMPIGYIEHLMCPPVVEPVKNKKVKNPMKAPHYINNATTIAAAAEVNVEATQRDFMAKRIRDIRAGLGEGLRKQFNMDSREVPRTPQELIDAIKNGKFSLDEKIMARADKDAFYWHGPFYGIIWGDAPPDTDGFEKADKALEAAAQEVTDTVTLAPIDEARKALKDFQSWTYSAA